MTLANPESSRAFVLGGSSGIGLAAARAFLARGLQVTLAARSPVRLAAAAEALDAGSRVSTLTMDMTDADAVEAAFDAMPARSLDHLVITASNGAHGAFASLAVDDARALFDSKFWGPYRVVRAALPALADGAGVVLFSGVLSRRPGMNCSALGAVNSAVEGLGRSLALELGPRLRVNVVSPGMVRTEAYAHLDDAARDAMFAATGESLPLGRVGEADEVAEATVFAATSPWLTGQVIDIDGGHMVRQYATR